MRAFLILEDGTVFTGVSIGAKKEIISEIVFNTSMTGYLEVLTDPSYAGQAVVMTYPLIGNYGICHEDMESAKPWPDGYIVRELSRLPSNFRSEDTIQHFLEEHDIPGISGIDTRALTKILREKGTMNGMITTDENYNLEEILPRLAAYTTGKVVERVTCAEKYTLEAESGAEVHHGGAKQERSEKKRCAGTKQEKSAEKCCAGAEQEQSAEKCCAGTKQEKSAEKCCAGAEQEKSVQKCCVGAGQEKRYEEPGQTQAQAKYHVALLDLGAKRNIARSLCRRGCQVTVYPSWTTAEEIIASRPDGIMLSNGPGDPKECTSVIEEIRKLYQTDIPIFAICLGHQLMALACGADTHKMKYGHRGGNHPVKDLQTGRVYISSQNHGYVVDTEHLDSQVAVPAFVNVNDGTNEGLSYTGKNIFTVQFHPEACPGPQDSGYLFDRFLEMMEVNR